MWRTPLVAATLALAAAPAAAAAPLYTGPGPRPGPDVLYAEAPRVPQLENTGIWRAAPLLVSGASAYRDGEFLYQDFLFDDHGARLSADLADDRSSDQTFSAPNGTYTYPTDRRYAGNAADLVEIRIRALPDAIAFRLTFNSMIEPALVATTLALGSSAAPLPVPFGANVRMPAQVFVTVRATAAEARDAATSAVLEPAPTASVDLERRQIEVRVPRAVWEPGTGVARVAAASGLWDDANSRYLVPGRTRSATAAGGAGGAAAAPAFFNVGFRTREPLPDVHDPGQPFADPRWWRDRAQAAALADGDLSELFAEVDFGKLAAGATDEGGLPRTGALNRILPSHFEPGQGLDPGEGCGGASRCEGMLQSRLQPYAVYVPAKPAPAQGYGLTLLLHSLAANYNQFSGSRNQSQLGERTSGHIVITPSGRGPDGWYYDLAEADTFEVWADVARHYPLDPDRVAITGYSMGGYGTYKLATRFPDLFGTANTTVGPPTLGVSATGTDSTGGAQTSTLPQLESLRHIPIIVWAGTTDQLVPFSGVVAQVNRLDALGLRYIFDAFAPADHFALAVHDQYAPVSEFLGEARVLRDPARVSYVVNPTMDFPAAGVVADHAYWLSDMRVADRALVRGRIDVRSAGFGTTDPQPGATQRGGGALAGGTFGSLAYARQAKAWGPTGTAPARDLLVLDAENISDVTIHAARARVSCDAELDIESSAPITVHLAGCDRTIRAAATRGASTCRATRTFTRARVRPAGRGLLIDAARRGGREFTVDVFRQSAGRRVVGERRVARFTGRSRAVRWNGAGSGDGVHVVRLTARVPGRRPEVRRFVVVRRHGRFAVAAAHERREGCGTLRAFKLERPVFGGRTSRALGISFRLGRESRVAVRVSRGGRTVRRFAARVRSAGLTHRLRLRPEPLAPGTYKVTIDARPVRGGARVSASLTARRL